MPKVSGIGNSEIAKTARGRKGRSKESRKSSEPRRDIQDLIQDIKLRARNVRTSALSAASTPAMKAKGSKKDTSFSGIQIKKGDDKRSLSGRNNSKTKTDDVLQAIRSRRGGKHRDVGHLSASVDFKDLNIEVQGNENDISFNVDINLKGPKGHGHGHGHGHGIHGLHHAIDDLNDSVQQLNTSITTLSSSVDNLTATNQQLSEQNYQLKEEISILEEQLDASLEQNKILEEAVKLNTEAVKLLTQGVSNIKFSGGGGGGGGGIVGAEAFQQFAGKTRSEQLQGGQRVTTDIQSRLTLTQLKSTNSSTVFSNNNS